MHITHSRLLFSVEQTQSVLFLLFRRVTTYNKLKFVITM